MATSTQVPALTFDPNEVTDQGSIPVVYQYDEKNQRLVEVGTDKQSEVAAMIPAKSRNTAVDVTITPLYIAPSRSRFTLTYGASHGTAKEYAVVSVSFSQTQALPVLNGKKLSWSATYSLVTGTQDVQSSALSAPTGEDTFQLMHLVDGSALLGVNFTTGTAGGSGLARWLSGAQSITGDAESSKMLKFAGATLEAANAAFAAIGGILSELGSSPKFAVDMASAGGLRVAGHSMVPNLMATGVVRVPQTPTRFVFTPSKYQDDFRTALQQVASNNQRFVLDPDDGEPMVTDSTGQQVTNPDPNLTLGPLAPFTLVVLEMSADLASS
jgi:hypothetical protein